MIIWSTPMCGINAWIKLHMGILWILVRPNNRHTWGLYYEYTHFVNESVLTHSSTVMIMKESYHIQYSGPTDMQGIKFFRTLIYLSSMGNPCDSKISIWSRNTPVPLQSSPKFYVNSTKFQEYRKFIWLQVFNAVCNKCLTRGVVEWKKSSQGNEKNKKLLNEYVGLCQ